MPLQGATAPTRDTQGVASLALGYVLHWAFSPPLLNPKLELQTYRYECNIFPLPVSPLINECVYFYCHLTLFARNKLIHKGFKSVR